MTTNSNSSFHHDPAEDEFLTGCLAPLDETAAPYRPEIADRMLRIGQDAFLESASPKPASEPSSPVLPRQKDMIAKALVALSALLGTITWFASHGPARAEVTFGTVLEKTTAAKSLKLRITREGETADVWVKLPGEVRWEETPTTYRIARGSRLWRIDEEANTYQTSTAGWYDEEVQQINLLGLLGIEGETAARFREVTPSGEVVREGKRCQVFRMTTKAGRQPVVIEAVAEVETGELQTLAVWPRGNRQGAPLAELALVARDVAVDEEQFALAKSLSEDGRIGKILDGQGIVTLRPVLGRRWTPVCRQMIVKPGDWLRTDIRGANASTVALTSGYQVIAGPGTLVELQSPHRLRLHGGEIHIAGTESAEKPLEVQGPKDKTVTIAAGQSAHYRIDRNDEFQLIKQKPQWLAGYDGSSAEDSIGSLVAKINDQDVPLTVGYHKVKVEIRDQIARTTIEESFVNHTNQTLEGVFHFPLPQDASISGFGMWIGGELIEADVVEKQRAREIYETILREKRDPGLLEWTGGNIFKARVYPIPAQAEKRIRIEYTQVLPLRGNQYRYSYALRSEMLRKTPLRELALEVQIHSAIPLKSVDCPTHAVRSQLAEHSAKLEFTAQEYTPERDFEIVCEVDSRNTDVVMIPHRRGEDGYFLVQLTPPGAEGNWQREILPEGEPLELVIVCDTSASMDSQKRQQQDEFVGTLLAALSPKDKFNLAVCDVDTAWLFDESASIDEASIGKARNWLNERISLGWTDLARMTESVLKHVKPETHVIYVGDGIVTAHNADPQEFINQLERLTEKKRTGTFHAVSVGNSFESAVLKALARVGGGSVRQVGGEQTPGQMAFELLNEIAQPGLKNLKVEFRGIQVAAVYPDTLPNVAAGTQQILIGRYLPQGKDQSGEIIITGEQAGKTVRFASRVSLADAEAGNSFIPRLWARAHLEHLLAQGASPTIQDQIIALSEEFHIMTPYTSLLVLESDADRERFGVKRRYQMRDGERFFAEGRDQSQMELLQQQMKLAGDWRLNLRRRILSTFAQLGRFPHVFERVQQHMREDARMAGNKPMSTSGPWVSNEMDSFFAGGGMGGIGSGMYVDGGELLEGLADFKSLAESEFSGLQEERAKDRLSGEADESGWTDFGEREEFAGKKEIWDAEQAGEFLKTRIQDVDGLVISDPFPTLDKAFEIQRGGRLNLMEDYAESFGRRVSRPNAYVDWVGQLFPAVPAPPARPRPPKEPKWEGEALEISKNLVQPLDIQAGGLEITQTNEIRDPRWNRVTNRSKMVELYSPKRWLHFTEAVPSQTLVGWCTEKERGMATRAFQLGQVREAFSGDLESYKPGERPYADTSLHETYREYKVEVAKPQDGRAVLTVTYPGQPEVQIAFTIDTDRHVILEYEYRLDGKRTSLAKYTDHVEAAGVWWPGKVEHFDEKSRSTSVTVQTVASLDEETFGTRFTEEQPDKSKFRLLSLPMPSIREAEIAVANGSADFDDRLMLLIRFTTIQQWEDVFKQLEAMEKFQPDQFGLKWIRAAVFVTARRNEEARQLYRTLVDQLADGQSVDRFFLANYALERIWQVADHNEYLSVLERARGVLDRQPEHVASYYTYNYRRVQALNALGRTEEALVLQKELAEAAPWDLGAQTAYARALKDAGNYEAAYAWLRQELNREVERQEYETRQLREAYAEMLQRQGRNQDYVAFMEEWIGTNPGEYSPYQQYLYALIMADRTDDADALAKKWMEAGRVDNKLELPALGRLQAAVQYALGRRYQISMDWIELKWFDPLKETAIFFLGHEHHFEVAGDILNNSGFRDSNAGDIVRAEVSRRLKASPQTLSPRFVESYIEWILSERNLSREEWKQIADVLRKRWTAEEDDANRHKLGSALVRIYAHHFPDTEELPFRREQITRAEQEGETYWASSHRRELFDVLLRRDWSEEHEAEAFALIEKLTYSPYLGSTNPTPSQKLSVQIHALHQFVDAMLRTRYQADLKNLKDKGHPENLTRTELAKKNEEFRKQAQEGLAKRLTDRLMARAEADPPAEEQAVIDELLRWIRLERMYLDLQLDRNQAEVAKEVWGVLGDAPKPSATIEEPLEENEAEAAQMQVIENLRLGRAFAMANYLAVRPSADAELVKRLKDYIAGGLKFEGDHAAPWKLAQFALLVALDEPEELERQLAAWIRTDPFPVPWQLALGRLQAERGQIEEAIRLFEAAKRDAPISPGDHKALGDWYLVVDRKQDYKRAQIDVFKLMPEYQINNWIQQRRAPWHRTDAPLPSELDERVLFAFQALFEKSSQPHHYIHELREFYTVSRDFRLLQMVPDALIGRTPQQIYPFLSQLKSSLLYEIRKEATADEVLKRLEELRAQSKSAIDLRALDLLEVLIERQAAEVLNQPGPHIRAATAALKRAFEREWADGEVRQMAEFLEALGTIKQPVLNDERLRQLRELHRLTRPGTDDRLFVAWHLAHALFFSHNQREESLATMQIALREYQATHAEGWPAHANTPLNGYIDLLEIVQRFGEAEDILSAMLENPLNPIQKHWLLGRRNRSYQAALANNGQVSLGSGETLYKNLLDHLIKQLDEIDDESHRYQTVSRLMDVFRTAKEKKYGFEKDLRAFAFDKLPELLKSQMNNYSSLVVQVGENLNSLVGPQVALEFLIDRYETYPKRFEHSWQNAWQQLGYRMADYHNQLKQNIGELEPRLLAIVLAELRRDLETRYSRNRSFYHDDHSNFWPAKAEEFARTAEAVYEELSQSGRHVVYIADYLYHGLSRQARAIEILLIAHGKKLLDIDQQIRLCDYLHQQDRHAESIPILEPIVDEFPNRMDYRTRLITAYNRASRPGQMRTLLADTDAHFRKEGRWTESNIAQLANVCLDNGLFKEAVGYYEEVISLHQRTAPNRGIGQGTLSMYYSNQARAYSALGETKKAVDAAAAGVIAWGPRHDQRQNALHWLETVLTEAKDLDEYVKSLDQKAEQTGEDSPLIRKKIGQAYAGRKEHAKAARQLEIALQLEPADVETHQLLIEAYDALDQKEKAIQQTLALLDVDRHNLDLYKTLADRLANDDALAERATTTIVEAAPNEAEHHQALAEIRQQQGRWADAIDEWKHVAELRSLEPDGLVNLAKAQIHEKRFAEARETIKKLDRTEWPARFSNVPHQIRELEEQIPRN